MTTLLTPLIIAGSFLGRIAQDVRQRRVEQTRREISPRMNARVYG